jgi:hypothetical protein
MLDSFNASVKSQFANFVERGKEMLESLPTGSMETGSFGSVKEAKKQRMQQRKFTKMNEARWKKGMMVTGREEGFKSKAFRDKQQEYKAMVRGRMKTGKDVREYEKVSGQSVEETMTQTGLSAKDITDAIAKAGPEQADQILRRAESDISKIEDPTRKDFDAISAKVREDTAFAAGEGIHPTATGEGKVPSILKTLGKLTAAAFVPGMMPMIAADMLGKTPADTAAVLGETEAGVLGGEGGGPVPLGMAAEGTGTGMTPESQAMMAAPTVSSANLIMEGLNITIQSITGMEQLASKVVAIVEAAVRGEEQSMAAIPGQLPPSSQK